MADDFADRLAREVPSWVDEDIVDREQAQAILERYELGPADTPEASASWARTLLYATSAVLLGAAGIALVFVGIDPDPVQPSLAAVGAGFLAAGLGLHVLQPERDLLVDALLAAALAPLAVATFDPSVSTGNTLAYGLPSLGLSLAYLVTRREQPFLPTLAVLGFTASAGGTAFNALDGAADGGLAWAAAQLVLLAALLGIDRGLRESEATTPVALAVLAFAGSLIPFLFETVELDSAESVELSLGAAMVAVLGLGVAVEHRGLLMGAAVALGVDAIAFAFTVGGVWLGIGVLVTLAVALIWQAEHLQDWVPVD